jgi:hypothetical protein
LVVILLIANVHNINVGAKILVDATIVDTIKVVVLRLIPYAVEYRNVHAFTVEPYRFAVILVDPLNVEYSIVLQMEENELRLIVHIVEPVNVENTKA